MRVRSYYDHLIIILKTLNKSQKCSFVPINVFNQVLKYIKNMPLCYVNKKG